jgi:hypothetical protein
MRNLQASSRVLVPAASLIPIDFSPPTLHLWRVQGRVHHCLGDGAPAGVRYRDRLQRHSVNCGFDYAERLRACLPRKGFPRACTPKTVSSTRRQYASMTLVFSADIPLVICISGPNPESVAVRLTII